MKKLLRILFLIYFFLIVLPIFAIATIIASLVCIIGCRFGGAHWASYYPGLIWSRIALILSLCPVTIEGKEYINKKSGPYVVVANHQSMYDIFAMYAYIGIPFKWVMKQEIRDIPFVGQSCHNAGFIFVDDQRKSSITQTMQSAKAVLAEATSIFIFPEGSRTFTGKMSRFKKGAFVMASELNCPILPVSIDGAYNILMRGKRLPHPHRIKLTIHKPFYVNEMGESPKNIVASASAAQQIIASVLPNEVQEI